MYAMGVTLWEIFSDRFPYEFDVRKPHELEVELRDLLTDPDDPLRPDLQLVDLRARPLLQVCALAFESLFRLCKLLISPTAALLGHGSTGQNQRC